MSLVVVLAIDSASRSEGQEPPARRPSYASIYRSMIDARWRGEAAIKAGLALRPAYPPLLYHRAVAHVRGRKPDAALRLHDAGRDQGRESPLARRDVNS